MVEGWYRKVKELRGSGLTMSFSRGRGFSAARDRGDDPEEATVNPVRKPEPLPLSREESIAASQSALNAITRELSVVKSKLSILQRQLALMGELQAASKVPWGGEIAARIHNELKALSADEVAAASSAPIPAAASANPGKGDYTTRQRWILNALSTKLVSALGTPWEGIVRREVREAMLKEGL